MLRILFNLFFPCIFCIFSGLLPVSDTPGKTVIAEMDFGDTNGNFPKGQKINVTYHLKNSTQTTIRGVVLGSISTFEKKILHGFKKNVEIPPLQTITISMAHQPDEAGLYMTYFRLQQDKLHLVSLNKFVGYDLEALQSPLSRKPDFDTFWASTKAALAQIKPEYILTRKPSLCTKTYQVYLVEMQSLGNQTIRGWYRVPIGKTNIPVVLQIPPLGGSLYDIRSLVESPKYGIPYDFAVLSLNIRGHGNSQDVIKAGNHPQQLISHGLKTKEEYIYRGAVMDCIRGIDFLHTRPELDKSKIIAEGASQGGALALLTAGLDIRVALCAPDVPFLCDIDRLVASTDWVERELRRYIGTQKNLSLWKLQQNLSYFDTKNIADKIRVPVLMSVGLQDWTCPAHTSIATYNQITSPKILKIYPHGTHEGGGGTHRKYKFEWIRKQSGL